MRAIFIPLLIAASLRATAQSSSQDTAVIETVFSKKGIHKDGYDAGGKIINIPDAIAAKMDRKKVRIKGFNSVPAKVDMEEGRIMQGRFERLPDGTIMTSGAYFDVISIYILEQKKWKLVYTHE